MNPHLFVYGSLVSSARHPMGERLRREARLIGPATIQARLYRISWYPGAVASGDPDERVHGEIYALENPDRALAWLDAYEGIRPENRDENEYERAERLAHLGRGEEIVAWVYLYRGDATKLSQIADGRWAGGVP